MKIIYSILHVRWRKCRTSEGFAELQDLVLLVRRVAGVDSIGWFRGMGRVTKTEAICDHLIFIS